MITPLSLCDAVVAPDAFDPDGADEADCYDVASFQAGEPVRRTVAGLPRGARSVQAGDLLLGLQGHGPRRAWVVGAPGNRPQVAVGDWLVLRSAAWDPGYARHVLVSEALRRELREQRVTAGGRSDALAALGDIVLALPPLVVQAQLAAILDRVEALRGRRHRVEARTRALPEALFGEHFGASAPAAQLLGDLLAQPCRRGVEVPLARRGRFAVIRAADLQDGEIVLADARYVSTSDATLAATALADGDVLLARLPGRAEVRVGIARPGAAVWFAHAGVLRLRPDPARVLPEYLRGWCLSPSGQAALADAWRGATARARVEARLAQVVVPVPDIVQQQRHAQCIGVVERLLGRLQVSAGRLDALLGVLRDRAYRGELALA